MALDVAIAMCNVTAMHLATYATQKKLSRKDLAKMLGLSSPFVSQLISGTRTPSLAVAQKIEKATGGKVKPADFYKEAA